jgi:hypothetical protein
MASCYDIMKASLFSVQKQRGKKPCGYGIVRAGEKIGD